jgi:hypothetical protein
MNKRSLPALYLPFPQKLNPHDERAWLHTVGWVKELRLVPEKALSRFRALDYHWLSAYAFPEAGLTELALVNDWMTLFYFFDKQWDDAPPQALAAAQSSLLEILRGRAPAQVGADPLELALHDVRRRMMELSPEGWMERFTGSIEAYFNACVWEARNKHHQEVPDVASYLRMRELTGAVQPSFELAGVLRLADIPPGMMEEPSLARLNVLANHVITLFNDLISFEKERRAGDMHNLLVVIQQEQRCSLEQAMQRAAKLHDDEVRAFIELESRLPSWGEPLDTEVRRYVEVLKCWMRANMDWSLMSERYRVAAA